MGPERTPACNTLTHLTQAPDPPEAPPPATGKTHRPGEGDPHPFANRMDRIRGPDGNPAPGTRGERCSSIGGESPPRKLAPGGARTTGILP